MSVLQSATLEKVKVWFWSKRNEIGNILKVSSLFNKLNIIVDKIDSNTFNSSDYNLIFKILEENKFLLLKVKIKDYFHKILSGISSALLAMNIVYFISRHGIYSQLEMIISYSIFVLVLLYWVIFFHKCDVYSQRFILLNFFKNSEFKLVETIANEDEDKIVYEYECTGRTDGQIMSEKRKYTEYYHMSYGEYSFTLKPYIKTTCYCSSRSETVGNGSETHYVPSCSTYGEIIIIFYGTDYEKIFKKIALLIEDADTKQIERLLHYDYGFTIKFDSDIPIYSYKKLKEENELVSYQIEASIMEPISVLNAIKTLKDMGFGISIKKRFLRKDIFIVSNLKVEYKVKDITMFSELVNSSSQSSRDCERTS